MTVALPKAELALTTRPNEAAAWIDVSAYVQGFSCRRGRQRELDKFEVGQGTLVLDNRARTFDPSNAAGVYYGNLKRMRRARMSVDYGGAVPVFAGYAERWPQDWPMDGLDAEVNLPLIDGLGVIALKTLSTTYPEQLTSERVNAVLDDAGWTVGDAWVMDSLTNSQLGITTILGPVNDRLIMVGNSSVQAATLQNTGALQHLQDVTQAEDGLLFATRAGIIQFVNRHYIDLPANRTPKAVFGDAVGELPYVSVSIPDDTLLYNEIRMGRQGGTVQTAEDATSQLDYFLRTLAQESLLATLDTEMADRANVYLSRYKDPLLRFDEIVIDPEADAGLWPVVLAIELGDVITVTRRPPGGGAAITLDCRIEHEAIDWSVEAGWRVVWRLSPIDATPPWLLAGAAGDAFSPYSVLGVSTVLGY